MRAVEEAGRDHFLCDDQQAMLSREEIQQVEAARLNVETQSDQVGSLTVVADDLASPLPLDQDQENKNDGVSMSSPKILSSFATQSEQASRETVTDKPASGEMEGISVTSLSPQEILQKSVQRLNEVQTALPQAEKKVRSAVSAIERKTGWSRPFKIAKKVQRLFFRSKGDRARAQHEKNAEELAALYEERETLLARLGEEGNKSVALENGETHSKEVFVLGEKKIPLETFFQFGAPLRAQIATRDTEYFLEQLNVANEDRDIFGSIRDDLNRATFVLERQGQREELYDSDAAKEADTDSLLDAGIEKVKGFADSPALQAAVASAMHQGIFSDIMVMEAGGPLPSSSESGASLEYYREGLPELFSINVCSRAAVHRPEKIKYELIEESPEATPRKIILIATREVRGERLLQVTGQKFAQIKQDVLIKTIEENPHYDKSKPLSVENTPVIFKCLFGHIANEIVFDPNQWKSLDFLLPEQQAAVVSYRKARQSYESATEQAPRSLNRIAGRAASIHSLMSSERIDVERRLQEARNALQQAIGRVKSDPETAPFLLLNSNYLSEAKVPLQLSEETIQMPQCGSFIGGERLQEQLTSELQEALRSSFRRAREVTFLETTLKKKTNTDPSFFMLEEGGKQTSLLIQDTPSSQSTASAAVVEEKEEPASKAMNSLRVFLNNDESMLGVVAEAVHFTFHRVERIILQVEQSSTQTGELVERRGMPGGLFGKDLLLEGGGEREPVQQFHFHLEKRESAEGILFVLTLYHQFSHQLSPSAREANRTDYERDSKIVYTFQKNLSFDSSSPISPKNEPVRASCRYLKIKYEILPAEESSSATNQSDL